MVHEILLGRDNQPIFSYTGSLLSEECEKYVGSRQHWCFFRMVMYRIGMTVRMRMDSGTFQRKLVLQKRKHWLAGFSLLPLCVVVSMAAHAQTNADPLAHLETQETLSQEWVSAEPLAMSQDQALWAALAFEDAGKVATLLKRGADPDKPEELSQMTPLMAAETAPIASLLLEHGANIAMRDRMGRTALHYAVMMRDAAQIIPLLIRQGADVNSRASNGDTPLMVAVENYGDEKEKGNNKDWAIRELVHLGADIHAADSRSRTPLAIAASHNQVDLIRLLIQLGANPAKPLSNGRLPLDYARENNANDAIKVLELVTPKAPFQN